MNFNILLGSSINLPSSKLGGRIYITDDTSQMFVDVSDDIRLQINDIYIKDNIDLQSLNSLIKNKFYFDTTNNRLYFNSDTPICLNELTSKDILDVLQIGNGLTVTDNRLVVDITDIIEEGNTKPVSSKAVYNVVGNIETALAAI